MLSCDEFGDRVGRHAIGEYGPLRKKGKKESNMAHANSLTGIVFLRIFYLLNVPFILQSIIKPNMHHNDWINNCAKNCIEKNVEKILNLHLNTI